MRLEHRRPTGPSRTLDDASKRKLRVEFSASPNRPAYRRSRLATRARLENADTHAVIAIGRHKPTYTNANFPTDAEGRTYHLGTKEGEVAPRILSVGSVSRAQLLSTLLEPPALGKPLFQRTSSRGFLTITGRYEGLPVSIVSTHMGLPNMDFVVRENRAVVRGQMAIIRLGTCGAVQRPAKLGDLLIATHGSIAIRRDPDYWTFQEDYDSGYDSSSSAGSNVSNGGAGNGRSNGAAANGTATAAVRKPYVTTLPVPANPQLAALLAEEASRVVGRDRVVEGLNASADSFYSSQRRVSRCVSVGSIKAIGMCVALAERYSNAFLEYRKLEELEIAGGTAALRALVHVPLEQPQPASVASLAEVEAEAEAASKRLVQYVWDVSVSYNTKYERP
ncbi:hypothetical protein VOLCADRAFT_92031 [Volvox carteri f. nagariensis]|uniref:Nucleoside phosphorylase domain-containing protein n=1 Tax=Volvox carteri f. nagariensis TaxID=3068 RepID=D8TYX5_VOLCA|nr:uncharacterized protein VOLCADRAFT_92031 [Volvox carteri f. nagariensis]EFJ47292.1 hypothetical protein VOLCADRAFT_92031 [Volvox carteri f. nagariensis]|eukprot:XP_002951481.1 hypothetical protein VOLCADRAFT_92031 [Volvox carteri f. nagariensis]